MQATWSNGGWADEVLATLELLEDPEVFFRLRVGSGEPSSTAGAEALADLFVRMVVMQASQRCWSMSVWSEVPPLQWAGILDSDEEAAQKAFAQMRKDAEVVQAALRGARDSAGDREAGQTHTDTSVRGVSSHKRRPEAINIYTCVTWEAVHAVLSELWVHKQLAVQAPTAL